MDESNEYYDNNDDSNSRIPSEFQKRLNNIVETGRTLTRRDFLLIVIDAVLIGMAGKLGIELRYRQQKKKLEASSAERSVMVEEELGVEEENETLTQRLLREVKTFRLKLGLEGYPDVLVRALDINETWSWSAGQLRVELPIKLESYGIYASLVLKQLFDSNVARLVKEIGISDEFPYGFMFVPNDRACYLSEEIRSMPLEYVIDFILHELGGHGSDPALPEANYPIDILLKVVHGKWRALSQAFSVEGQFYNHAGDAMYPLLKKQMGEYIARSFVEQGNLTFYLESEDGGLQNIIDALAKEQNTELANLKWNKRVCFSVGAYIIEQKQAGNLEFKPDLQQAYQNNLEEGCVEIYAEMFKYAIRYPELIDHNPDVMGGIQEVIAAIQGKDVSLEKLQREFNKIPDEVLERFNYEEQLIIESEQENGGYAQESFVDELDVLAYEEQELQWEQFEQLYRDFVTLGDVTGFDLERSYSPDTQDLIKEYGQLLSQVYKEYGLTDTFAQHLNWDFDPYLHIWEIRDLEWAIDSGFTRNLLKFVDDGQRLPSSFSKDLVIKNARLREFISSSVFGTNSKNS